MSLQRKQLAASISATRDPNAAKALAAGATGNVIADTNFNMGQFAREVRKATLPTHVVETQEEADQINEWIQMVTDIRAPMFNVGDRYFLLPMHA